MNRHAVGWSIGCVLAAFGSAHAGEGLDSQREAPWPRWQARVSIQTAPAPWRSELAGAPSSGLRVRSLGLMGDYYFMPAPLGERSSGGFRATSGVVLGSASGLWSLPGGTPRRIAEPASSGAEAGFESPGTVPYAGVGYTGWSRRGGWGFSADLGLMAVGTRVRLGQPVNMAPRLDEVVRDLRLMPVLQLGVSYSF